MRMQVILDSSFARPGSASIWGGKKGDFRDWTRPERYRAMDLKSELKVPGLNPPPCCYLDLFSVLPSSTPRPRCVIIQLVSLSPVGILNSLCSICNVWLLIYSVPN